MTARLHVATAGRGPAVALIHGWGLHGGAWGGIVGRLAAEFTVHAVDLPGHGGSPRVAGGLDGWVEALAASLPPAHLVGWSLGGQLALALAAARPARALSLALVATTPRFVAAPDWPAALGADVLAAFAADLAADPQATLARFLALQAQGDAAARTAVRELRARLAERPPPAADALADALALLAGNDLRRMVRGVAAPTLLLHGGRDPLVPAAAVRWLARALPQARLESFPAAAHAPFVTAPDAFAGALAAFVNDVERYAGDKRRRHSGR